MALNSKISENINSSHQKLSVMLVLFVVSLFSFFGVGILDVKAANQKFVFDYTGDYQTFVAPETGIYKIQAWGAQGGASRENNVVSTVRVGGYGSYTAGMIDLQKGQTLYIYVGGKGKNGVKSGYAAGGYNGGGRGDHDHSDDEAAGGGGGATDIRLVSGAWNDFASLKSRIMVAAGGGGTSWVAGFGHGGGLNSNATSASASATQTSGYSFGTGQPGVYKYSNKTTGGGGGGYYGGYATPKSSTLTNGSGGSSFISGYDGADAISEESTSDNIIHTGQSIHYSGLKFDYAIMVRGSGQVETNKVLEQYLMPNIDGTNLPAGTGKTGNGYAIIEYIEDLKQEDYPNFNIDEGYSFRYSYTGNYQTFTAPADGTYKLEAWGARGGYGRTNASLKNRGGFGSYAAGTIHLSKGDTFYVYVGQAGYNGNANCKYCGGYGGWNGGAKGGDDSNHDSDPDEGGGGGGATDFRLISGTWNDFESLKSRVIIAAGGAGGAYSKVGLAGGLYLNQTNTYQLGVGQPGKKETSGSGGGGGGYFGGKSIQSAGNQGYGGTSYVSGSSDDLALAADATSTNLLLKGDSIHYSGVTFQNPTKVNGNSAMPSYNSTSSMTGNNGHGYAKVTVLELDNRIPKLKSLTISNGTMKQTFDPDTYTYDIYLDSERPNITISGEPLLEGDSIFRGMDSLTIKAGTTKHHIGLINELGNITVYTLNIHRPASSYSYLDDIKIDGVSLKNFDPKTLTYEIPLEDTIEKVTLEAVKARPSQEVSGEGETEIDFGTTTKKIEVVSEDGSSVTTYTLHFKKSNSSKLKSLDVGGYQLTPTFDSDTLNYSVEVSSGSYAVDVEAIPYDKSAKVTITGNGYLAPNKANKITILVEQENAGTTIYQVDVKRENSVENEEFKYACKGEYQEFTAPGTTYYKIQSWGARGGYGRTHWTLKYRGGYGAYTEGEIYLSKGQKLYIYVGCAGKNSATSGRYNGGAGGWNGGAKGGNDSNRDSNPEPGGGGGGATDIRLVPTSSKTVWNEFESLKSRIMVTAGGGGGNYGGIGGAGGTITGVMGSGQKALPNQTSGYAFGYGMPGGSCTNGSGGAGGGYFGGYTGTGCGHGGGGGSSYVSGCEDCVAITEDSTEKEITPSDTSVHSSSLAFEKITMLSGTESMPNPNGGYMTGNNGNGYVIITAGKDRSSNNFLREITTDKGTLTPTFDMQTYEYDVTIDRDEDHITLGAKLEDDTATLTGIGTFSVPAGTTAFPIVVTAENGDVRTYTVNVTREASSNALPNNIKISGLVPSLCAMNDSYCKLSSEFDPATNTYSMTVPSRIKQLQFSVIKGHEYQTVVGDGIVSLNSGMNMFTIEITSEDGKNKSTYTYHINRDMTGNASIESLEVIDPVVNINFDPDITEYYFSIPNEKTSVELKVVLEDTNATYEILGNENFETGLNVVTIRVTAQNGETKDYILNIYREQSGNVFLSDLKASHGDVEYPLSPVFNKIVTVYTVNVPNEIDKITLDATAEHPLTTVSGTGEKTLKTGTNTFDILTTSEDGSTEIYKVSVIRAKSNDATLKQLDVLEGSLSPTFDKTQNEYKINVNPGITSLHINAVPTSDAASYKIVSNSGFKVGMNTVQIIVTAEDGTKNTYTLKVNRIASENADLDSLTTDEYDMTSVFDKDVTTYNITLENDIKTLHVKATAADKLSKITGTGIYNLQTGNNEINVMVTAENGDTKVYTLNVFRKRNSNANLLSVTFDKDVILNPTFDKDTVDYQIEVENEVDEITIAGLPEVKTTTVSGNGTYALNVLENVITLKTTAEDGTEKTYTFTINRKKSSNCNASSILAKESVLEPLFDKSITSYELRVLEAVTSLNLTVQLEDTQATYVVEGNENFEIGHNTVKVIVTAEDGTTKEYVLDVLRQEAGTTSNKLDSLSMKEKSFSPTFDPETLYYEVTVPYQTKVATLIGELDDKNATVTGLGEHSLVVGQNVLAVQVTSTEGIVRTYQVIVTREENDEARLANLSIAGASLNPNFNKDVYEYKITSSDANLVITAVPVDSDATYEIIGGTNLPIGNTDVIIRVTAKNKKTTKDYVVHVDRMASDNNNLKSLSIDDVEMTPEFSKTTTVYYATVPRDVNNIQVNAVAEDENATVSGDGNVELEVGKNYVEVIVTSESGKTKNYTIIVTRTPNDNNYLSSLTVSEGALNEEFSKTTNDYTVTVPYEVDDILIGGTAEDPTATVDGFDKYALEVGENVIPIKVTSESGNENVYHVTVTREEIVSSKLKNLEVVNYSLDQSFNSDVYDYVTVIDYEVTSLNLNIETLDKNATYVVSGNENFAVGMNTVTITVTDSKNLTTSVYTLHVNRQSYSNTFLSYIDVSVGTLVPDFEKTNLSYTVNVASDVEEITILAEAEIESNTVTGCDTYTLTPGDNKIPITVTSPTGIKRTYYVNVIRALKNDNYLESLVVKVNNEAQTLTPEFDKDTLSYDVTVPAGTTNALFVGTFSKDATAVGLGNKTIKVGDNSYNVVVTSQSGNAKTYTINIHRPASTDNFLTEIIPSVGTLEPAFSYYGTEYNLKLDSSASLLSFDVSTSDRFASVTGTDIQVVPDGTSTREIIVTAEDGTERKYTIHVTKNRTDEARLSSLSMNGYTFNETFDKDTFTYTLTVPNTKKTLLASEIEATPIDPNAKVEKASSIVLSSASTNIYTIVVTAQDGFTKQTYYINIEREKGSEARLASLKFNVGVLSPNFNSSLEEYTLTVPNTISKITKDNVIEAIATDDAATVTKMEELVITGSDDIYKVEVLSGDKTTTTTYNIHVVYDQSNDATLKSLTVDPGKLEPEFSSATGEYTVNVKDTTEEITIIGEVNDEKATILSGLGTKSLTEDESTFEVTVQAEDGTIKIYTIHVIKSITTERLLQDIRLTGDLCETHNCNLTPSFTEDTFDYKAVLDNEVEQINIEVLKKNKYQTVKFYDETDTLISNVDYKLKVGVQKIRIDVTNGLGDVTSYHLEIERKKSSNNYLKTLEITNTEVDLAFDKETHEYFVSIPNELDKVVINAIPEVSTANVRVSGSTYLTLGNNDVIITVTAEDGTDREYIIHVCRENETNYYLASLTISSGVIYETSPKFQKGVFDYVVTVPSTIDQVEIDALPEVETTTVVGLGEHKLKTGVNSFTITTTSKEGVSANYNIIINKEKSKKLYLKELSAKEGSFNETFNRENTTYTMNLANDVSALTLKVVPEDPTVTYKVYGNQQLVPGENKILIVLTSQDKTVTTTYQLIVNKKASSNNYLKSLKVDDTELITEDKRAFTEFQIEVDKDKIDLSGQAESPLAKIDGFGVYSLNYGDNKIKVTVEAEDGSIRTYTVTVKRTYDVDLFMITTNRGDLTPTFEKDTLEYYLEVERDIKDITIMAVASSDTAKVEGNGYHALEVGENVIPIKVSQSDGTSKTYTLHITRNKSNNNYLKELYVHEGKISPDFDKETLEYSVEIPYGITSLTIDQAPEDKYAVSQVLGNENLKTGDNEITIKVTSEKGESRNYVIHAHVQTEEAYSNRLKNLTVSEGNLSPDFDPDTLSYTVTVPTAITNITISGVLESVDATVVGLGTFDLALGRNEFPIVITSKDQKIRTYSVIVYRVQSSDPRLKLISFKEGTLSPLFDKDIDTYTMKVDSSVTSLTETVEPLVQGTTYEISGHENIQLGENTILVEATAGDGVTKKTYTIHVTKEKSTNNYLSILESNIGELTPSFTKTNAGPYVINVDESIHSIELKGRAEAATSTVTGLGVHQLTKGKNTILITVTSESSEVRTYTVVVNRALNNDNKLMFLGVSDGTLEPEFNPETTSYQLEVDSALEELTVLAIANDKNAVVSGNGVYKVEPSGNNIDIVVTAEDGSTKTYTIHVNKKAIISSKLLDIKAHEGKLSPEFEKNTLEYLIMVPNEVTSLTLDITKEDETATYEVVGNSNFLIGANQVRVVVTSKEDTTTYILNVIRQQASNNYLKELTISEGRLSPDFEKTTIYYETEVSSEVSSIDISALAEDANATVSGTGEYSLQTGNNYIYVDVTSTTGILRTYTIKVVKKESNANSLLQLSVDKGVLDPAFHPDINNYVVDVDEGVSEINITAKADPKAIVTGTGSHTLTIGENTFEVVVTAENGDVNTYVIVVNKKASSNTKIENIIPSSGVLTPSYTDLIDSYEVTVDENIGMIDFEVITESEFVTVSGNQDNYLNYGDNPLTITVTAEDGSKKEVYINVIREKNITSIDVDKEQILMDKGDTETIVASVLPEDATNKEIGWTSSDPSIVYVDHGVLNALEYGTVDITVYSIKNPEVKKVITVNVINLKISSNIYEVRRNDGAFPYIIGAEQGVTLAEFVGNLENNPALIHFYFADGTPFTDLENEKVKTGELVQLEYEGKVYDQLYIAVYGEMNGDGEINVKDYNTVINHTLKKEILENYWFAAGNVKEADESIINVKDSNQIQNRILKKVISLKP